MSESATHAPLAHAVLNRYYTAPGVQRLPLPQGLVGALYLPTIGRQTKGAVLVLGGSEGGSDFPEAYADALASRGIPAMGLACVGAPGLPQYLENIPLEYFQNALAWLKQASPARPTKIAVHGTSRGGELALVLGATMGDVDAVIANVPSHVTWGTGDLTRRAEQPSWTATRHGLPFVPSSPNAMPEPVKLPDGTIAENFTPVFLQSLKDHPREAVTAQIPIERTRGPILMYGGCEDQIWPSSGFVQSALARLAQTRPTGHDQGICYPGAGRWLSGVPGDLPTTISTTPAPEGGMMSGGGNPAANAHAQRDAWERTLQFLLKNL